MKTNARDWIFIGVLGLIVATSGVWQESVIKGTSGFFEKLHEEKQALEERLRIAKEIGVLLSQEHDEEILMPVENVFVSEVSDTWHEPRGNTRLHEGQDIFALRGALVRSATEGVVSRIGRSSRGGNHVFVTGAGGRRYYYAHLEKVSPVIREGSTVSSRTIIGLVGNSGNAEGTPPHLHFGVYTPFGPINPLPLMRDRT